MDQNRGRESVQAYLRERANRPFGDAEAVSGRTLEPFSVAGQEAAENLLAKAWRALDNDDPERAGAYVDRAVRLPFDEREKVAPVAWAVHMVAIDNDFVGSRAEHRRIRSAIASAPDRPQLAELDLAPSELREHVLAILGACRDYEAVLASLDG